MLNQLPLTLSKTLKSRLNHNKKISYYKFQSNCFWESRYHEGVWSRLDSIMLSYKPVVLYAYIGSHSSLVETTLVPTYFIIIFKRYTYSMLTHWFSSCLFCHRLIRVGFLVNRFRVTVCKCNVNFWQNDSRTNLIYNLESDKTHHSFPEDYAMGGS